MKIIVTGAAGHFGSNLVGQLLQRGSEVIGIDNLLYGGEGLLACYSHPRFKFQKTDLLRESIDDIGDADAIVHLAALVGPVCDLSTDAAWATNYTITARLCETVRQTGIKLILASTCSNYGILKGTATESSPLDPIGTYAETKVEAEKLVLQLEEQVAVLRFGTLAGISPRPRLDILLNQWSYEALSKGVIECYQPEAWRPFVHVADASDAVISVLTNWQHTKHRCYNVVGFNTTKLQLAMEVMARTGCRVTESSGTGDLRNYSVDGDLIKKDLGFNPRFNMAECVNEVCSALELGILQPRPTHYNHN